MNDDPIRELSRRELFVPVKLINCAVKNGRRNVGRNEIKDSSGEAKNDKKENDADKGETTNETSPENNAGR